MPDSRMTAKAYHEAGHVVAAFYAGFKITEAWISPDRGGAVLYENPYYGFIGTTQDDAMIEKHTLVLVTALAGLEAQQRHDPQSVRKWQVVEDRADVLGLMEDVQGEQREREAYLRRARKMAKQLIESRWSTVEKVAAALLERNRLTGDNLTAVINGEKLDPLARPTP